MSQRKMGSRLLTAAGLAVALTAGRTEAQITISSNGFDIGSSALVSLQGDPSAFYMLFFDTRPGDFTLPSGAWFGLGLSPDFTVLDSDLLTANGTGLWSTAVPNDPTLIGYSFYLQATQVKSGSQEIETSNRLSLVVSGGGSNNAVVDTYPKEFSTITPTLPVELLVGSRLLDGTVSANTVKLKDSGGNVLPATISLDEGASNAVIRVTPDQPMPRGDSVKIVLGGVKDESGNLLTGQLTFNFPVGERQHPVLINNMTELNLYRTRINQGQSPWKPAWDYLKKEVDRFAMPASPKPHSGKPPTTQTAFNSMYYDWFTDSRYALDCAMAWHITGQTTYASKARSFLTAWLVFDPAVVGKWYWSIQYDIAGLNYALAADYLWDYSGLTTSDKKKIRTFLDDVALVVQQYQSDTSDTNPGNIRSWNNTLVATVGYFNDRDDLVQWAMSPGQGNPFHYWKMFDDAMAADGEMYDTMRGSSTPYEGITYPAYHLHAWSMLSEVALHHGVDLYRAKNRDGNTQLKGWQWLYPYMDGSKTVSGLSQQIIEDFIIAKTYMIQRIERQSKMESLYNKYSGEPLFETHITKKAASFSHNMPSSLVGADGKAPQNVINLTAQSVGVRTVLLVWSEGAVADEGDLAYRYDVYRNGKLLGQTGACEFVDGTASPGTSYTYKVVARDYVGNPSSGTTAAVTTRPVN